MTPRMDVEKAIQFLLDQQAQSQARFDLRMDRLTDHLDRLTERVDRIAGVQEQQQATIAGMAKVLEHTIEDHRRLSASTEERFRQTDERFRQTDVKIEQLTQNVNVLVRIVDEMIRRDGRQS